MPRLALLLSLASLWSCSSIATSHDHDPDVDFASLETYAWVKPMDEVLDELALRRATRDVDEILASKGYSVSPSEPDFLVAVIVGRKDNVRVVDWGYTYHPRGTVGMRDVDVREYTEFTLIVDVVSSSSKELIWRGSASGTVEARARPEERSERILAAVEEILAPFPPGGSD